TRSHRRNATSRSIWSHSTRQSVADGRRRQRLGAPRPAARDDVVSSEKTVSGQYQDEVKDHAEYRERRHGPTERSPGVQSGSRASLRRAAGGGFRGEASSPSERSSRSTLQMPTSSYPAARASAHCA